MGAVDFVIGIAICCLTACAAPARPVVSAPAEQAPRALVTDPTPDCAPDPQVSDVALGEEHTCALTKDGAVYCWGKGDATGDPNDMVHNAPYRVLPAGSALDIVAGDFHTCVRSTDRRVQCWGTDLQGQLGDGPTTLEVPTFDADVSHDPAEPPDCAVTRCRRAQPGVVPGLDDVELIFAGGSRTCARSRGKYWCWGGMPVKPVGDESEWPGADRPFADPKVLESAKQLALGRTHYCSIDEKQSLLCLGSNRRRQLNLVFDPVRQVSTWENGTCALTEHYTECWGGGWRGARNGSDEWQRVDRPHLEHSEVEHVVLGGSWGCSASTAGKVTCWGLTENLFGEKQYGPEEVSGHAQPIQHLRTGRTHTCLVSGGRVRCFGSNHDGQLGNAHVARYLLPHRVAGVTGAIAVTNGFRFNCAIAGSDRHVLCWGDVPGSVPASRPAPAAIAGLTGVHQIAAGSRHACAILGKDRHAVCWGRNEDGELGQPDREPRSGLQELPWRGLAKVAVSNDDACALGLDGSVACWGEHRRSDEVNAAPVISGARDITLDEKTFCYIDVERNGFCRALASTSEEEARRLPGEDYENVHAFGDVVCATTVQRETSCHSVDSLEPVALGTLNGSDIAAIHGRCVVDRARQLTCQVYSTWDPVIDLEAVTAADASCAVHADGSVSCWGSNDHGEVDGVASNYHASIVDVVWPAVPRGGN